MQSIERRSISVILVKGDTELAHLAICNIDKLDEFLAGAAVEPFRNIGPG